VFALSESNSGSFYLEELGKFDHKFLPENYSKKVNKEIEVAKLHLQKKIQEEE
jgi:hypothetical protein